MRKHGEPFKDIFMVIILNNSRSVCLKKQTKPPWSKQEAVLLSPLKAKLELVRIIYKDTY